MKILVVSPYLPFPIRSGCTNRTGSLIRELAKSHDIDVLALDDESIGKEKTSAEVSRVWRIEHRHPKWQGGIRRWLSLTPNTMRHWRNPELRSVLSKVIGASHYDLAWCIDLATYHQTQSLFGSLPVALDRNRLDSDYIDQRIRQEEGWLERARLRELLLKVRMLERRLTRAAALTTVCSERDRDLIMRSAVEASCAVVPNGVACENLRPKHKQSEPQGMLFVGALDYPPNSQGLDWFLKNVFPRIHRETGELLDVVGPGGEGIRTRYRGTPGVRWHGFVDDLRHFLHRTKLCVVPVTIGGGTRLKVLEAMAAGAPIVSTSAGMEGLPFINEIHAKVEDTCEGFANAAIQVLRGGGSALANNALEFVQGYDWSVCGQSLESAFRLVCSKGVAHAA